MRSVNRRTFLKAAGGLAASSSAFLSACSSSPPIGTKKVLNFWAFSDTRTAWQKKAWELYKQQKQPDFEINWLIFPYQQMHDRLLITAEAGSGGPDIADIEIGQFSRFIKAKKPLFVDLAPKLTQMGVLDQLYSPSATDPWTWQGKIFGMGNELNTCLWSYRWDVLQKAGIQTPIATWNDFAEAARKFHRDTGNYLLDQPYLDSSWWWLMTLQQKGGYFGPSGQPTLNSPASIRTLTYNKQSIEEGWTTLRAPLAPSYNAALASGYVASILGPSWNFSGFIQQAIPQTKGKWHLQPMPTWDAGGSPTATWGGTGVSVLSTSQYIEEAVDFVTFEHTTTEALLNDFKIRQVWPTYKPALADPLLSQPLEFFDNQRVGQLIQQVSPLINKWYNSPYWSETTDACARVGVAPALMHKEISAEAALNAAQAQALRIINFETA